jgi:gliding motility-associated-like protein
MRTSTLISTFIVISIYAQCQFFEYPIGYSFRNRPSALLRGDFDGNGLQDIAFTAKNSPYFYVNYHEINGEYSAIVPVVSAIRTDESEYLLKIEAGDFNEDGIDDIAAINYYKNSCERLYIHLSNGRTFNDPIIYEIDASKKTETINVADFDKDGHLDLLIGFSTNDIVHAYHGKGEGTFGLIKSNIKGSIKSLCIDDFNNDGLPDIVYFDPDNKIFLFHGVGDFTFLLINETEFNFPTFQSMVTGKFLDPKKTKIAMTFTKNSYHSDAFVDFFEERNGQLALADPGGLSYVEFFDGNYFPYSGMDKLDFNTDNKTDLLCSGSDSEKTSLLLWESKGVFNQNNSFIKHEQIIYRTSPIIDVKAAKSTNKPWDVALIHEGGEIMVHTIDENVNISKTFQLPIGLAPSTGKIADLNNDDLPDIIVGNAGSHTIAVLYNKGGKQLENPIFFETKEEVKKISISDMNEDGFADIVFTTYNANTYREDQEVGVIFSNAGSLTNRYSYSLTLPTSISVSVADFNHDNHKDILSTEGIFMGSGTGTFTKNNLTLNNETKDIEAADFDADGNMDFIYLTEHEIGIVFGVGDGTFSSSISTYAVSIQNPFTSKIYVADTNNDGLMDIYIPNSQSASIFQLINLSNRSFDLNTIDTKPAVSNLVFTDFNKDNVMDIAAATNSGVLQIFIGNGDHTFITPLELVTAAPVIALESADFDQDGIDDIIAFNSNGPNINFLYGRTSSPDPKPIVDPPPTVQCTAITEPNPECQTNCQCDDIFFPNVFTPNGDDSLNSKFTGIWTDSITSAEIEIIDRWGETIFNGGMDGWDGTIDNREASTGLYYWTASYVCEKNQKKTVIFKKGYLHLVR